MALELLLAHSPRPHILPFSLISSQESKSQHKWFQGLKQVPRGQQQLSSCPAGYMKNLHFGGQWGFSKPGLLGYTGVIHRTPVYMSPVESGHLRVSGITIRGSMLWSPAFLCHSRALNDLLCACV